MQVFFGILIAGGFLAAPAMLIWSWIQFAKLPQSRTVSSILSFIGLILATTSAILGAFIVVHATAIGGYPYYDPRAMRIYAWGVLLSVAGIALGIGGAFQPGSLRWQVPVSGLCILAFWIIAALGE